MKKLMDAYHNQPKPIEQSPDMIVGYCISTRTNNGIPIYQTSPGGRLYTISPITGTVQSFSPKTQDFRLANNLTQNRLKQYLEKNLEKNCF